MPLSSKKKVLVTGSSGFIGFHVAQRLCREGFRVTGLDNMNEYYDVSLKQSRLEILRTLDNFTFHLIDLTDRTDTGKLFERERFDYVIHLAAQAGVRYSLTHPFAYLDSNLTGFLTMLEACRKSPPLHFIFASSSSVYGANKMIPHSTHHHADHPLALYGATKRSNELMAHSYASLFQTPSTGLRFFTAYGPYGRPDMALFIFTKAILEGKPIDVYNNGNMSRDFTYIDDIVESIVRLLPKPPSPNSFWDGTHPDPATSRAPYRILNIGSHRPEQLLHFIEVLEDKLGKKAIKNYLPLQPGDVLETYADISDLEKLTGYSPVTAIEEGIGKFVTWYKEYYRLN